MPEPLGKVFDKRAKGYVHSDWHVRYAERLVDLAKLKPGMRVLDAATGTGFAALAMASAVGPSGGVVGVDVSAGMLEKARQAIASAGLANVELVEADATSLAQFSDGSFDAVLCSAGLLYMPVDAAVREWHRVLAGDGLIGFSTMCEGYPVASRLFRDHAAAFGLSLADPATPLGTVGRCRDVLVSAGFQPDEFVTEPIRFARSDLNHAWEAHVNGSYHHVNESLSAEQLNQLRASYTEALADMLDADEDLVLDASVIYAFGRATPR